MAHESNHHPPLDQSINHQSTQYSHYLLQYRYPFNTIKVDLSKGGTGGVSTVLQLCTATRDANMSLAVGCLEGSPEVHDSFIADLAVAVGADQYYGGGTQAVEYVLLLFCYPIVLPFLILFVMSLSLSLSLIHLLLPACILGHHMTRI
jgi:hypothetical protein